MERKNLWAPWRIGYVQGLSKGPHLAKKGRMETRRSLGKSKPAAAKKGSSDCFICHNVEHPKDDDKNLVLWRTDESIVILNRFPYNNGHLLIAPARHIPDLEKANSKELLEMFKLVRESQRALSLAIKPHGFNVGMNFGRCAGAGLPDHFHIHIVPRWDGDTNFMNVCNDTDVISQSLTELLALLKKISKKHKLPSL